MDAKKVRNSGFGVQRNEDLTLNSSLVEHVVPAQQLKQESAKENILSGLNKGKYTSKKLFNVK